MTKEVTNTLTKMNKIQTIIYIPVRMYRREGFMKTLQTSKANPGLKRRLKVFEDEDELQDVEDFEQVENIIEGEADFMSVHKQHKLHERYYTPLYYTFIIYITFASSIQLYSHFCY